MSLQNLQAEIAEAIFSSDQHSDLVRPIANLVIYKNNVTEHLIQALIQTYPMIVKLVGEDYFRVAANHYIQQYPARSGNLHEYGEYFSHFLLEYTADNNLPYLAEVAQLEWACHLILFAADHAPLAITSLENLSTEEHAGLYFILHPASQLIAFHYPIERIMALCRGDIDDNIDLNEDGVNLLIFRPELEMTFQSLTDAEFTFLITLRDGGSLSEALSYAMQKDNAFNLETSLPQWVQDKVIVDCYSL